ncbi:energy-coupling factor transporter transmembrane protein EcfT [Georgenia sp. TF02-10]|nr:energy-coupling factor transporter transmembrane protein EcfT [Georgenia sp. TF02-10]
MILGLLLTAVVAVVLTRRGDSPWGRAFRLYLLLGVAIVVFRMVFYVLVGLKTGGPVLLDLPRVALPDWAAGITLLGPVHTAGLVTAAAGGLQLAVLVVCFGAANALANPKRALRHLPAALHPAGTAVVIAVTVNPQLVSAVARVRRAQRLRGLDRARPREVLARAVPVLQDAMDQALALAASMDSRGYGRRPAGDRAGAGGVGWALLVALLAAVLGVYGLLDGAAPAWLGAGLLAAGAVVAVAASVVAGRRVHRTRYRPEPWGAAATAVAACGVVPAVLLLAVVDPAALALPVNTLTWPPVPPTAVLAALVAALPVLGALVPARGAAAQDWNAAPAASDAAPPARNPTPSARETRAPAMPDRGAR